MGMEAAKRELAVSQLPVARSKFVWIWTFVKTEFEMERSCRQQKIRIRRALKIENQLALKKWANRTEQVFLGVEEGAGVVFVMCQMVRD